MTSHLLPTYPRVDLAFERGEGAWLIATDGERYLDFTSGVAVNALGHSHPQVVEAVAEQAKKLSISDRINLVEEIWDTIAEENQAFELSDSQKRELDRRLETARSNAGQGAAFGRTWEEIKAEFMKLR